MILCITKREQFCLFELCSLDDNFIVLLVNIVIYQIFRKLHRYRYEVLFPWLNTYLACLVSVSFFQNMHSLALLVLTSPLFSYTPYYLTLMHKVTPSANMKVLVAHYWSGGPTVWGSLLTAWNDDPNSRSDRPTVAYWTFGVAVQPFGVAVQIIGVLTDLLTRLFNPFEWPSDCLEWPSDYLELTSDCLEWPSDYLE